ncbi:MAG: hypothetical protein WC958_05880 [Dehalococcoidales bacterium]
MKRTIHIIAAVISFAYYHAISDVVSIFSYGPSNYVSSGERLLDENGVIVTTSTTARAYSETQKLSPDYSGPVFFGGWEPSAALSPANGACQIQNDTASGNDLDPIMFRFVNQSGAPQTSSILLTSKLSEAVSFEHLDSFSFSAYQNSLASYARAVIKIGDNYYISATSTVIPTDYPAVPVSIDITNWIAYDPLTSIADISGTAVALNADDKVGWVGFHFVQGLAHGTSQRNLFVRDFDVTAIPESTTIQLFLISSVGFFLFRHTIRK